MTIKEEKAFVALKALQDVVFRVHGLTGIAHLSKVLSTKYDEKATAWQKEGKTPAQVKDNFARYLTSDLVPALTDSTEKYGEIIAPYVKR
jgi:hypothetical protein